MKYIIGIFFLISLLSCDSSKLSQTSDSKFIGKWKYECESLYNGITIEIQKNKKGKLTGIVKKLNDEKLIKLLMDSNFVIISDISRNSNFEFSITENKLGKELFGLYNLSTINTYKAQFINDDLIGLSSSVSDPTVSKTKLRRIKN